jgi:hypothetical protein
MLQPSASLQLDDIDVAAQGPGKKGLNPEEILIGQAGEPDIDVRILHIFPVSRQRAKKISLIESNFLRQRLERGEDLRRPFPPGDLPLDSFLFESSIEDLGGKRTFHPSHASKRIFSKNAQKGNKVNRILKAYPELNAEKVRAALEYAAEIVNEEQVVSIAR